MKLSSEDRVTSIDPVFGRMGIEAGRYIWEMAELTMREKAILVVVADVCTPHLGLPFELHLKTGLSRAGMSVEDFRELLRHIGPEVGYGITSMAFERLVEVAKNLGFDPTARSDDGAGQAAKKSPYPENTRTALRKLDGAFADYVEGQAAELWERPQLSRRERCVASLGVDVIGQTLEDPFRAHVEMALTAGMSQDQIRAVLRFIAEFALPKAWQAFDRLPHIFRSRRHATITRGCQLPT